MNTLIIVLVVMTLFVCTLIYRKVCSMEHKQKNPFEISMDAWAKIFQKYTHGQLITYNYGENLYKMCYQIKDITWTPSIYRLRVEPTWVAYTTGGKPRKWQPTKLYGKYFAPDVTLEFIYGSYRLFHFSDGTILGQEGITRDSGTQYFMILPPGHPELINLDEVVDNHLIKASLGPGPMTMSGV